MAARAPRILLADDEQSIQTLLSYPLTKDGYEVVSASNGEEALARTPQQLAVLREAGVVDAGGAGLLELVRGLAAAVSGEPLSDAPAERMWARLPRADRAQQAHPTT